MMPPTHSEQASTEHNVVDMRHNVVGIVDEDVNGCIRHVNTAQSAELQTLTQKRYRGA